MMMMMMMDSLLTANYLSVLEDFARGMIKPVAALAIVVLAITLSVVQRLKIEKDMAYAITRSFIQLSIIGFVLEFIFSQGNVIYILLAYLFMVSFTYLSFLLSSLL